MKRIISIILPVFFLLAFSTTCYSQIIGKLFTKEEANILYGKILESITINSEEISKVLNQTNNYVMFKLSNGRLIILDENRKVLSPINISVSDDEGFYVFSKSKVEELLILSNSSYVIIENRLETLTITSESYTLELAMYCPPFCIRNVIYMASEGGKDNISE